MKKWMNGKVVDMKFEEEGKQKLRVSAPLPKEIQIEELKKMLADTDYISNKIIEGDATIEQYQDLINKRKLWRQQIRQLEK